MSNRKHNKNPKFHNTKCLGDRSAKMIEGLQSVLEWIWHCTRPKCCCHDPWQAYWGFSKSILNGTIANAHCKLYLQRHTLCHVIWRDYWRECVYFDHSNLFFCSHMATFSLMHMLQRSHTYILVVDLIIWALILKGPRLVF